jgi:hypothetical protein
MRSGYERSCGGSRGRRRAIEVTTGGNTVTSEKFNDRPHAAGTTGTSSLEVTRPVYTLVVEKVSAVNIPSPGPACR